ncbi:uncharacterized protein LOC116911424 isoform X1 [Rattus rattus]|uniref:uncharacterized protein LOC116911424 isoform X1 n=1 Tax=Rattus rattus TaxID=10117 RepID=UPI0013F2FCE8|nr:uncharacterized protein LOC116911424 isoform X1 [Rattus rattus]
MGRPFEERKWTRASPAETHRQEAGAHGDRPGEPASAHPAAGAPTEGSGRSQKPAVTHTRMMNLDGLFSITMLAWQAAVLPVDKSVACSPEKY